MVLASSFPMEARKVMAHRLETLSCIVPKSSLREANDDAATESNATVFPLKESYRKNIQNPHSNRYWDNAAKDYRNALVNEIVEEEEEIKSNAQRPKMRKIPDMPPRSHSHRNPQIRMSEVEGFGELSYQNWNRAKKIHEREFRDEIEHFHQYEWEADHRENLYHQRHDAHYNAILDVQEDEDRRGISETRQSQAHFGTGGEDGQLQAYVINQEFLRLKAISDKHERENAMRKASMKLPRNEKQETCTVFTQPLSVESIVHTNKDDVFDSQHSGDPFSVSNLSSPTIVPEKNRTLLASSMKPWRASLGLSETTPSYSKEPLRRSASFDSRWKSFRGSVFVDKAPHHSLGSTAPLKASLEDTATLSARAATISTNEGLQKEASFESVSESIRENELMSKITVIESQHSLDPIFVSAAQSPPLSNSGSPRDDDVILEKDPITEEGRQHRFASFDRHERTVNERGAMRKGIASASQSSSAPLFSLESSSSPSAYQNGQGGAKSSPPNVSSGDLPDMATAHEHIRRHPSPSRLQRRIAANFRRSNEDGVLDSQLSLVPTAVSESSPRRMSWHEKRAMAAEQAKYLKDPTFYGSSHIELTSPAVISELSYTPGASIRPITPSPTIAGSHKHHFEISPERDIRCDKGKRHQFYEANPFIPAYSDSVIIGRPISPENFKGYGKQEHGSIDGLSPVTCSGSQFRNSVFPNTARHGRDQWGEESVDREPIERSNETIKVQHLSSKREVNPNFVHPPPPSQTCMPMFNKKLRSVVDRYHQKLKESSGLTMPQAKPGVRRKF
ncbi:unnamed protein product [Cylindrotheca closterium]|uniref:Uncharacterized protein n=1 Tax=Cylindrotheca closterium TaxID=2856 RepID=A0AAD2CGQ6_9STRA|nr:unnamed protein product [Cylindrotheca closterium]